jgi:hypothetical protein
LLQQRYDIRIDCISIDRIQFGVVCADLHLKLWCGLSGRDPAISENGRNAGRARVGVSELLPKEDLANSILNAT